MADWKEKLGGLLPDLKDQRIQELELEVGRLTAENKNLRGKLSAKDRAIATRETDNAQLQHARHKALDRRGHVEALLEAAQAEVADLKRRLNRVRRAVDGLE